MNTLHKIVDLLWKKSIREKDFCNIVGISTSSVSEWKRGKTKSYLKHIEKIADVLGVTTQYLLDDNIPIEMQKEKGYPADEQDNLSPDEFELLRLIRLVPENRREELFDLIRAAAKMIK